MKISIVMAQTIDGKIARSVDQNSIEWNSLEDKKHFREISSEADCMIIGSTTYKAMGQKGLPGRKMIVMTLDPSQFEKKQDVEFFSGSASELFGKLKRDGMENILVTGGASINSAFLSAGLVDEIYLTIEPLIFGKGMSFVAQESLDVRCNLIALEKLNDNTILLHYKVLK